MADAFVAGAAAGYGVAIPLGAIAVLIIGLGLRHGFVTGAAAGLGAATADGVYATVALLFGAVAAALLAPWDDVLAALSAAVLVIIAVHGLRSLRRPLAAADTELAAPRPAGTFVRFLGLTALNPLTVTYFAALVVGLPAVGEDMAARAAFVAGVFLASLSWQWLLAAAGAAMGARSADGFRLATTVAGNVIVLLLALRILTSVVV